jgi:hypothetical protein
LASAQSLPARTETIGDLHHQSNAALWAAVRHDGLNQAGFPCWGLTHRDCRDGGLHLFQALQCIKRLAPPLIAGAVGFGSCRLFALPALYVMQLPEAISAGSWIGSAAEG